MLLEYSPRIQSSHTSELGKRANFPSLQLEQPVEPLMEMKLPELHAEQTDKPPTLENVPTKHKAQPD
jgi:hypothetical protein